MQQNKAQKRKEELQKELEDGEDEEDSGEQTPAVAEVEAQARFLEAEQAASRFISSRVQSRLLDKDGGGTYSTVFSGNNNSGVQIGYSAGTINWNTSR